MSLQGSLRQLGLADLLQGALAGKTGNLYLSKGASRAVVHVEAHQLRMVAPDTIDAETLSQGLVHRGVLDAETYHAALEDRSPVEALDHLLDTGDLPRPEVDQVLRGASEDAILDLITWQSGEFRFRESEPVPVDAGLLARISIDTGGVLLRAAQRLDERSAIANHLGLEAHLFFPLENEPTPEYEGDPVNQIHALLDGARVVDEIAILAGLTRFATLRGVLACVRSGAARTATPEELKEAVERRRAVGQTQITRSLLLQWASVEASNTVPLQHLVSIARAENKQEEAADALLTLAHVHLQMGEADKALPILKDLVTRDPDNTKALSALSSAADTAGDRELYARSVTQLARTALGTEEPERAAQLLTRLVSSPDAPLQARVLAGRAYVELRDKAKLETEAEAVRRAIGRRARNREEKEALAFFRDALTTLAPERGDLLRQMRAQSQGGGPARRVAILVALLAVAGVAGFVFWPPDPSSIYARAETAAAEGNRAEALRLCAVLLEDYPDSPEAMLASSLQARVHAASRPPVRPTLPQIEDGPLGAAVIRAEVALPNLPDPEAIKALAELRSVLARPESRTLRQRALSRLEQLIIDAAERLNREIRVRTDTLAQATMLAERRNPSEESLRSLIERTLTWEDDGFQENVARTSDVLDRLFQDEKSDEVRRRLRDLGQARQRLTSALRSNGKALDLCRRNLARVDLQHAYDRCLTDAARYLVTGQFEDAEKLYGELGHVLARLASDPVLQPLLDEASRRGFPQFLASRRGTLDEIRNGLDSGLAAEEAGNLKAAVKAYAALAQKFRHIRFETVIKVPLRVRTIPEGATVRVNGEVKGKAPILLHYPWETQVTLTVEAPGYEKVTHLLAAGDRTPPGDLVLGMAPLPRWVHRVDPTVQRAPVAAGQDVLVCDRSGRVQLHRGSDGEVIWARHIESLEGIRARPLVTQGLVYLPFIDGKLYTLELADGRVLEPLDVGRSGGDPAAVKDLVAVLSLEGTVRALRGRSKAFEASIGGRPAAGLIAAHDAFWAGAAEGHIARVSTTGDVRQIELSGREVPVVGLAAYAGGVIATKADGTLHALDQDGNPEWQTNAVGDVVGTPAVAAGIAACIDSRGRILLFDIMDGAPRGQVDLRVGPRGGLIAVDDLLVVCLRDGRLWAYDPATCSYRISVDLGADEAQFGAGSLGGGLIVAPGAEGTIRVFEVPFAPKPGSK